VPTGVNLAARSEGDLQGVGRERCDDHPRAREVFPEIIHAGIVAALLILADGTSQPDGVALSMSGYGEASAGVRLAALFVAACLDFVDVEEAANRFSACALKSIEERPYKWAW
jgi:hypothetical protein